MTGAAEPRERSSTSCGPAAGTGSSLGSASSRPTSGRAAIPDGDRVVFRVHTNDELAADLLWSLGASAVTEEDEALVVGFTSDRDAAAAARALRDRWRVDYVAADGSADAWRAYARPVRVGPLTIHPAWIEGDPAAITIEPGSAFGIGDHATTRLALQALVDIGVQGKAVLDVGTGTGVLALAAARLGARAVTAIDIDEHAAAAARSNVAANGASDVVTVIDTPLARVEGSFEVVVANLGGLQLPIELAPELARTTSHVLVVSGLLDPAATGPPVDPLDHVLVPAGLSHHRDWRGDGWLARSWAVNRQGRRGAEAPVRSR